MECLRYKQAEYMAAEATKLLNERKNAAICIAPESFASAEVVNNLVDTGHEIYEMSASRLPSELEKPVAENYASEAEYLEAEKSYKISYERYNIYAAQIETMVEQGRAQFLVDVSRRKPELCYRVIPETEKREPEEKDTVEKLRTQDKRNREIAIEKGVEDVKRLVREKVVPGVDFQPLEEELLYYVMLSFTRKENFTKLGISNHYSLSDEEKAGIIPSLTTEQKNVIKRDFIVKHLSDTSGNCKQSQLLLEFAALHFPDKVREIKEQYNEAYRKKHIRIEERIRELQPFNSEKAEEAVVAGEEQPETVETPDPETFDDPDTADIPLYPGLPEHASVGEIPEEKEEAFNKVIETLLAESETVETPDPGTFDEPDMADIPLYPGLPEHVSIGEIPEEEEETFDTVYEEIAA
jgi:ParB family chromosome partitioning protein